MGPGSFTGLRVGVGMAKVFAYAVGSEIVGMGTLETIAAAAPPEIQSLAVAVDAQRGDVVAQQFHRAASDWLEPQSEPHLLPLDQWLAAVPPGFAVSGPALKKWNGEIPEGVTRLDPALWSPRAANVARLAYRDYRAGRRDDIWKLLPLYSRRSAAEEKLENKQGIS